MAEYEYDNAPEGNTSARERPSHDLDQNRSSSFSQSTTIELSGISPTIAKESSLTSPKARQAPTELPALGKLRILLLDGESLVRFAFSKLLSGIESCEVVAEACDADEAFRVLSKQLIDVIVLEMALPRTTGIDFLLELQRRKLQVRSIVLSHVDSPDMITQALLAGAQGYILKSGSYEELLQALETLRGGNRRYLPPQIAHLMDIDENKYELGQIPRKNDPLCELSAREREIFHLLANGFQNTAIAKKLFISPRTVETHRARIVRKLKVQTNGELIRFAIKHGLSMP